MSPKQTTPNCSHDAQQSHLGQKIDIPAQEVIGDDGNNGNVGDSNSKEEVDLVSQSLRSQ